MLVTPLQLADAYAAFANGGTLYQPPLADEVTREQRRAARRAARRGGAHDHRPIGAATTGLDPEVRDADRSSGLDGVVYERRGHRVRRRSATTRASPVVGKTGTARDARASRTPRGSRRSPTPTNDPACPQYVVVAMVEQGGFGADVAAPIVRRVIDFLNEPDRPPAVVVAPPDPEREEAGLMATISPSRIAAPSAPRPRRAVATARRRRSATSTGCSSAAVLGITAHRPGDDLLDDATTASRATRSTS